MEADGFVRAHTRLTTPALVPELTLHLADEAFGVWEQTECETGEPGQEPPYWAFAWVGGQALARFVLDHPHVVAGRSVLDLAAGSGLVAIAAAMAGACEVLANDVDPYAAAAIGLNAAANQVPVRVSRRDMGQLFGAGDAGVDLVLAGDVFYQQVVADRVLPIVQHAYDRGASVLVGDPGRGYLPRAAFELLARYEVPDIAALEDADVKATTIWRFRRRQPADDGQVSRSRRPDPAG